MGTGRITDPTNRDEFKTYIRALLGEPAVHINVTEFQTDIAVDESLKYYRDYHYLGSWHAYYVHVITQDDLDNKYITLPDDIKEVVCVYDNTSNSGMGLNTNLYSGAWQMNYDLVFNQNSGGGFLSYYMNKSYYDMLNSMIVGMKPTRYNMHRGKLYLDYSTSSYTVGSEIILDCWQVTDPDLDPDVWSDRWLIRYAVAKLKRQWGENLSKFTATLPGGVTVNGDAIKNEAVAELTKIEEDCLRDYSEPPRNWIG
jgi:hypothetical protein